MRRSRPFLALWTLAVMASVIAFVLHLGLRGRIFKLGYEMGKERNEQARLREAKRVLELEVASFQEPPARGGDRQDPCSECSPPRPTGSSPCGPLAAEPDSPTTPKEATAPH